MNLKESKAECMGGLKEGMKRGKLMHYSSLKNKGKHFLTQNFKGVTCGEKGKSGH